MGLEGMAVDAVEAAFSCAAEAVEKADALISDECRGAIDAFMRLGYSEREATELAIKMGFYDPDELHGDPHWRESAALQYGARFVEYEDGSIEVFDQNGNRIALMDCEGRVVDSFGDQPNELMIDSEKCELDDYEAEPEPAPAPLEQPVEGPRIQTVEICRYGVCEQFSGVMIFNSVESVQAFLENPDNVLRLVVAFDRANPFVIIEDGEGSVQCLPIELDIENGKVVGADVERDANGRPAPFALEMFERTRDMRSGSLDAAYTYKLVGHMQEGEQFNRYISGYEGTEGSRNVGGREPGIENGETFFPSAPQQLIQNPDGTYSYESIDASAIRTMNTWVVEANIDAGEWAKIRDMQLPEVFADPSASFDTRVNALIAVAAERGVTLDRESAEELTRIITEMQGKDAGLGFNERKLDEVRIGSGERQDWRTPARDVNGRMLTLEQTLFEDAQRITVLLRAQQAGNLHTNF